MARYHWAANIEAGPRQTRRETLTLEIEAEQLLLDDSGDQDEYPFYTQRWIEELSARELPVLEALVSNRPSPVSDQAIIARLIVDAQLTRKQRVVIRLMQRGLEQQQIAEILGVSDAGVTRLKHAALTQMRAALGKQ